MAKPNMKYKVVSGLKPGTSQVVLHPQITERESIGGVNLVKRALASGNCRGQIQDILGQLNGMTEAMQALNEQGKAVTMSSWIRIAPKLHGTVGEDRKLTAANSLKVAATALTDMKKSIDDFSWTNVNDSGVRVKVATILYVGGTPGFVKKGKEANLTGKNLQFDAALGDTLTIAATGLASPASVTPTESDYSHIRFTLPAAVEALADNAELTITLTSRGGIVGAADQVNEKTVTLLAGDPVPVVEPTMTEVHAENYPTETNRIRCSFEGGDQEVNDLSGTGLNGVTKIEYGWHDGAEVPEVHWTEGEITEKTATLLKFKMPEVQFGDQNGHLRVTWSGGQVTSSFTVMAVEPE